MTLRLLNISSLSAIKYKRDTNSDRLGMEWDKTFSDDSWTILKDEEDLAQERTVWEGKIIVANRRTMDKEELWYKKIAH